VDSVPTITRPPAGTDRGADRDAHRSTRRQDTKISRAG